VLASSRGALDLLRDLVLGHGITTVTRIAPDDEMPAIRSLLQLDGDIVVCVHPDAIGHPGFAETWHRHWAEVTARIATVPQAAAQLRALTRSAGLVAGGLAALFGHGAQRFVLAVALPVAAFVAARAARLLLRLLVRAFFGSVRRALRGV